MSYDLAMVVREFAYECKEKKIGLGLILEQAPEKVPKIPKEISDKVKKFLISNNECSIFTVHNENKHETVLYNKDNSVEIIMTNTVIFFKTRINDPWPVLDITVHLYEEIDYELIRYDYQDGHWG